jgi:hypothetical protein
MLAGQSLASRPAGQPPCRDLGDWRIMSCAKCSQLRGSPAWPADAPRVFFTGKLFELYIY